MFAYASRTGTRRNLDALRKAGWGLMLSAKGDHRTEGFERYCIDNGAWWAYSNEQPFDESAFLRLYELYAVGADFVVLPDIVAGGERSLEFSLQWRERIGCAPCPLLLAVQDGMTPKHVCALIGTTLGVFVGGTSEWKERTLSQWGALAHARGAYLHVGRVNSVRRIRLCAAAGADSFDGSSVSRYSQTLAEIGWALNESDLFAPKKGNIE